MSRKQIHRPLFSKVPLASFHAHHFRSSLERKQKQLVSLRRSLASPHRFSPLRFASLRSPVRLARSFLRSANNFCFQESIVTGSTFRKSANSTHTISSWLPPVRRASLRSSPPLGPFALRPSWPRTPGPSFRVFPRSVQGHLKRIFRAPLHEKACPFVSRHIFGIPSERNPPPMKS